jgi:hypothetical protein
MGIEFLKIIRGTYDLIRSNAVKSLLRHFSPLDDRKEFQVPWLHLLHFPALYLLSKLPLPEGRTGTAWEHSDPEFFWSTSKL